MWFPREHPLQNDSTSCQVDTASRTPDVAKQVGLCWPKRRSLSRASYNRRIHTSFTHMLFPPGHFGCNDFIISKIWAVASPSNTFPTLSSHLAAAGLDSPSTRCVPVTQVAHPHLLGSHIGRCKRSLFVGYSAQNLVDCLDLVCCVVIETKVNLEVN
jgi:hypothetical protein